MSNVDHNSSINSTEYGLMRSSIDYNGLLVYSKLPEDDVYNPRIYPDKKKSNNKKLKLLLLAMMMNKNK
jgi:hypothetical protein